VNSIFAALTGWRAWGIARRLRPACCVAAIEEPYIGSNIDALARVEARQALRA